MVILGREPVIVDTGTAANRRQWFQDVFSLVDPEDVRWIFISHDDPDHTGNLKETLAECPNATLVSSWFQVERLTCDIDFPLRRMRWVNDGETFDAGDRVLAAVRPPVYDSPTTRGLYDAKTRVYWASDAFATPVLKPVDDAAEIDADFWRQGFEMGHMLMSPWLSLADQAKFNRTVDRIAALDIDIAAGAHTPAVSGGGVAQALAMMRQLPSADPAPLPGQADLEAIIAGMSDH
jgi:flavorubredoxin